MAIARVLAGTMRRSVRSTCAPPRGDGSVTGAQLKTARVKAARAKTARSTTGLSPTWGTIRLSATMVAIAMLGMRVDVAHAEAPASAPSVGIARVPMFLVDAPTSFDVARFGTSLETYVTNAVVVPTAHASATDDLVCADAMVAARNGKVAVALWARWTVSSSSTPTTPRTPPAASSSSPTIPASSRAPTPPPTPSPPQSPPTLIVSMVSVDKGCGAIESSTVDVPPEQPDFVYRVAALKIASLLRVLPEAAPEPPVEPPHERRVINTFVEPPFHRAPARAIDLGVTGVASGDTAARTYSAVASFWLGTRFSWGGGLYASAAHDADAAGGTGSARVVGAFGGARLRAWARGSLAIVHEIDLGLSSVWASADRSNGADAMTERAFTPFVALAPHIRIDVAGPLRVTVGPTLDIALRAVDLRVGETPLYHAGVVRFRWDARVQLSF